MARADLFNTEVVAHNGHLPGTCSKCSASMPFHKQGREFPVFTHNGLTFDVVICSDGGYSSVNTIDDCKRKTVSYSP